MKHILRLLIRLYPAWWRRRYGRELEALLEDSGSHDVWDVLRGAMEMQMKTWSFGRIVMVCGIAGVVVAGTVSFLFVPYPYRSTAVLRSEGDRSPDDWSALSREAFTAQALSDIIRQEHLYADAPAEDVMDRMRRGIRVRPAAPNLVQVSFGYDDPIRAQRVSQDLVSRIVAANLSPAVNPNRQVIELVEPADQARRQIEAKARTAFTALGLPAGLLFGVLLALILRRRTPAIR
jgi:hypothetical protein